MNTLPYAILITKKEQTNLGKNTITKNLSIYERYS